MKKVLKADYDFKGRRWRFVSPAAKQFVQTLIQIDPNRRPTAHEALELNWLSDQLIFSERGVVVPNLAVRDHIQATIQTFAEYGTLKKLALLVIAFRSSTEEVGFLKEYFNKFDTLKQGELNLDEFKEALSDYDYTDKEVEDLFNAIDLDQTGLIHYSEFLAATIEANGDIDEERLAEAFDRLDSDSDGFITVENLHDFLGDDIPQEYLDAIIEEADLAHDHRISYDEFLAMFYNDDTDSRKEQVLAQVEERRHHHEEYLRQETMSTISSCGSENGHDELDDLPEFSTATHHFKHQKEKSIRNAVWI
jgi:calcium-dependent protein kinase